MGVILEDTPVPPIANAAGSVVVRGYRPELDAVRFFAFLLVFIHHAVLPLPHWVGPFPPSFGHSTWRIWILLVESCETGLNLFFALSAYLITDLLLTEREETTTISVRRFYIRRALRIWPLYFVAIAIGSGIALMLHNKHDLLAFLAFLLFAGNFFCAAFGWLSNPMGPLWSISIEEQFYLIWPWSVRWFSKRGLFACAIVFILVANITLYSLGQRHTGTAIAIGTNTFVQFEMFATGSLLALMKNSISLRNAALGTVAVLIGSVLWFIAYYYFFTNLPAQPGNATSVLLILKYGLIAVGCGAVLQGFCMIGPSFTPNWVAKLGKISYGLYVFHVLAIEFSHALFAQARGLLYWFGSNALALVVTISAGAISYSLFEARFLRLKRRFEVLHTRPL